MCLGLIGNLIAHARVQGEGAPIVQFRLQLSLQAQQNVSLAAPVVGQIVRAVLHHAHTDSAKLASPPPRNACFTWVFCARDAGPICGAKGYVCHLHGNVPCDCQK